jgi:hypothetical protein
MTKCIVCGIKACYNFEKEKKGIKCKKHSEAGMVDVINAKCIICHKTRPVFSSNGTKPTHCTSCKELGMIQTVYSKCIVCNEKRSVYGIKGGCSTHCGTCRTPEMINTYTSWCIGCREKIPTFGFPGGKITHCTGCKEEGMEDLKHRKCVICKLKIPTFNTVDEKKATHCADCKEDDMVNVAHSKCVICTKVIATFNFKGKKKATHCTNCKEAEMVDVKSRKCIVCQKTSSHYNFEAERSPDYCLKCKLPGMIDIKNLKCVVCKKRASYNIPGKVPQYCIHHKSTDMIKDPRKKCELCYKLAIYGIKIQTHCDEHKIEGEYNLIERTCSQCQRIDILNQEGVCVTYCSFVKKDKLMKKNTKKKEELIDKFLKEQLPDLPLYKRDGVIDRDCSTSRPDFVYHLGSHILIIEVDENQHKSYTSCKESEDIEGRKLTENKRMFGIFQSFEGLPVIFLRYNPDTFRVSNKLVKISEQMRMEILLLWIKKLLTEKITGCMVKYLFYDDYIETETQIQEITEQDVI